MFIKKIFLIFIITFLQINAHASSSLSTNPLLGSWIFFKMNYRGQELNPPNPALRLILEFVTDDLNRIYYKRDDEAGFCERKANYSFNEKILFQKVVWVNPDNQMSCGQDPDMQLGKVTANNAYIKDGLFYLEMPLSDEIITYIWKKLEN